MKKYIYIILSVINAGITALYLSFINNDIIPVHYGIDGTADSYGSKWTMMMCPAILLVISIIYTFFAFVKKCNENESKNKKLFSRFFIAVYLVLLITFWSVTIISTQQIKSINNQLVLPLMLIILGALLIITGNMFGKIKQNRNFGIKIRATLKSETVWRKTHRLGGYLSVVCGIVWVIFGILSIFLRDIAIGLFIIAIALMLLLVVIIPTIYSEIIYRNEKKKA